MNVKNSVGICSTVNLVTNRLYIAANMTWINCIWLLNLQQFRSNLSGGGGTVHTILGMPFTLPNHQFISINKLKSFFTVYQLQIQCLLQITNKLSSHCHYYFNPHWNKCARKSLFNSTGKPVSTFTECLLHKIENNLITVYRTCRTY